MREALDVQGVWWLPETPEHKVPGWLEYDSEGGGTLRLAGSLLPIEWIHNELPDGQRQHYVSRSGGDRVLYARIHGQSERRLFNLDDAFRLSYRSGLCREDDVAEKVHVNSVITGALFEGSGRAEVTRAVADIQYLTAWINNDALQLGQDDLQGTVLITAAARQWSAPEQPLPEGLSMRLRQTMSTSGDHQEDLSLHQEIRLVVESREPRDYQQLTGQIGHFQDLVTIAAGHVANIRSIYLTHVDVPQLSLAGTPIGNYQQELYLYTRWSNRDEDLGQLSPYAMVFTFADLGGFEGVERWMATAHTYRSELRRIMAARYNPSMLLEDRVSHCMAALEALDRVRRKTGDQKVNLVDRLRECVAFAGEPFRACLGGESVDSWTSRAKNHRHALGHHLDRFRNDMGLVDEELADQLLLLSQLCLMRASAAPEVVFEKVGKSSHFRWVAERAVAAHDRRGNGQAP